MTATSSATATALPAKLEGFNRVEFEDTCHRRFFFGLSFAPYGGTAGLYDMGPPLCAIKSQFLALWRQHFILEETMCEIDTTCITPEEVLAASGHVEKFNDVMVRDTVTGECIRLDKHIEEWCEEKIHEKGATEERKTTLRRLHTKVPEMHMKDMKECVAANNILSIKGNALSEPFEFNLMFQSQIGPEGHKRGLMRPELAQGIILNFKRLMDTGNAQRMPFAAACIGQAFRNEIAPRAALLRVREFTLAEIEHFVNPNDKSHPKFKDVVDVEMWVWTREMQSSHEPPTKIKVGDAVAQKIFDNETLAYFMARTQILFETIGMRFIRFRQHQGNEMAHYAQDCWDAELLTSYGWTECVGLADRSAYDLNCHIKASGKELSCREEFEKPQMVRVLDRKINKGVVGKAFGKETAKFVEGVQGMKEEAALDMEKQLAADGAAVLKTCDREFAVKRDMVAFAFKEEKVTGRHYIPGIIEPSFGVGRILFALLEQSYWVRKDDTGKNDKRAVFSLSPVIAPQKVAVLPLMMKGDVLPLVEKLRTQLVHRGISARTDDSGAAIGKKYARIDELGIPFAITCDFEGDDMVTLRERDSAKQVRVPIAEVVEVIVSLCRSMKPMKWSEVVASYKEQQAKE